MEKNKIFKALICIGIIFCSVFLVGMKDIQAVSYPSVLTTDKEVVITFDKLYSDILGYSYVDKLTIPKGAILYVKANTSTTYTLSFSNVVCKRENYKVNDDGSLKLISTTSQRGYNFLKTHKFTATSDIYFYDEVTGEYDFFSRAPRLVMSAESLPASVGMETKTIIVMAVGLLGLLILSTRLLPGLKTFFRG